MADEYWTLSPWHGVVREVPEPLAGPDQVLIRTLVSGVSPGTETLVHRGEVPDSVAQLMQAPLQLGELPFPVSHGYLNVGVVEKGPAELQGKRVFTLAGHRSHHVVPVDMCRPVPEDCPTERALLAGVAEVALNAIWESQVTVGHRASVVGAGVVGLMTALLLRKIPLQRLQIVETRDDRREVAADLGLEAVTPEDAAADNDAVFHTSASSAGLASALEITGDDASLVEMSWYGDQAPEVPMGESFHARRLRLVSSQVGEVAVPLRARRSRAERLQTALELLDSQFDPLMTGRFALNQLPELMDQLAEGRLPEQLLPVITYGPWENENEGSI